MNQLLLQTMEIREIDPEGEHGSDKTRAYFVFYQFQRTWYYGKIVWGLVLGQTEVQKQKHMAQIQGVKSAAIDLKLQEENFKNLQYAR